MTEPSLPPLIILAPVPGALVNLGGISLLERLRRSALQLGYRDAVVLSNSIESISPHVINPSWHGRDISLDVHEWTGAQVTIGDVLNSLRGKGRVLLLFADFYCDARLIRTLSESQMDAVLVDSDPLPSHRLLWKDSEVLSFGRAPAGALLSYQWFSAKSRDDELLVELLADAMAGFLALVDAVAQESYIPSMRRRVRLLVFSAPDADLRPLAERLLRDATQKGVLDLPALVHSPIEKWIVSHLCRTSITPNQVTLGTGLIGLSVTLLYASGHLGLGVMLALAVGVLDGVDGKLARLKVQTTKIGKGEHTLDYFLEISWWAALAYYFQNSGQVPYAYLAWGIFFAADVVDRLAKWSVERRLGRSLDDVSRFDRLVRYVAGRRNIYTWLFAFCLLFGAPAKGFILLCAWGVTSVAVHILRAVQIRYSAGRT